MELSASPETHQTATIEIVRTGQTGHHRIQNPHCRMGKTLGTRRATNRTTANLPAAGGIRTAPRWLPFQHVLPPRECASTPPPAHACGAPAPTCGPESPQPRAAAPPSKAGLTPGAALRIPFHSRHVL